LIATTDQTLWGIRYRSEILVNDGEEALRSDLVGEEDRSDCSEARKNLEAAVRAAKLLIQHLDENYDFDGEVATLKKEETCRD
jgi:hypothetical protein